MAEKRENPFLVRTNEDTTKSLGKGDTGSRNKADKAADRAESQMEAGIPVESWPRGAKGTPMMKAEISVAELIPTGNYANVSIGPVRLHFLIDVDRDVRPDEGFFSTDERAVIAKALNEACEIAEVDVVAVQRNLVMENMQQQIEGS